MTHYTLYAAPFTCSFAVHLVLRQHDLPTEVVWVSRGPRRQVSEATYAAVNPKRKVPALRLPTGELLTEIVGILTYLHELSAPSDAVETRRHLEWLAFVSSEFHQAILGPAFDPGAPAETVADVGERLLPTVLEPITARLQQTDTLLGSKEPSGADAYLAWGLMLLTNKWPKLQLDPAVSAFWHRILQQDYAAGLLAEQRHVLTGVSGA